MPKFLESLVQLMLVLKNSIDAKILSKICDEIDQVANAELHTGLMLSVGVIFLTKILIGKYGRKVHSSAKDVINGDLF